MRYPNLPLFFGRVLGKEHFSIEAQAIAMYQPRDIALVLDYSGSMNDDSELKSIGALGFDTVLEQPAADLRRTGFVPNTANWNLNRSTSSWTVSRRRMHRQPQISVEYRYRSVSVTSTLDLSNVVAEVTRTVPRRTFSGLSGQSGTFAGTGTQRGTSGLPVWVKSGDNLSGQGPDYGEPFDFSSSTFNSTAISGPGTQYGHLSVSVRQLVGASSTTARPTASIANAGFEYKFGFANLISYWLEQKAGLQPDARSVESQRPAGHARSRTR